MLHFIRELAGAQEKSRNLTFEEASEAAKQIAEGQATDAQIAALLMAMRIKGETAPEIIAFAAALLAKARPIAIPPELLPSLVDCAGPHDGREGFAATIPVSVLCAAAGLPSLLHAAPGLGAKAGCSLQDILQAAGLRALPSVASIQEDLKRQGLAYYCAELFCPPLARLRQLREEIGLRTVLHSAEKLIRCGGARRLLVGVGQPWGAERLASLPLMDGVERAVIVQGMDGTEDLPVHKVASVLVLARGKRLRHFEMDPALFGLLGGWRRDYSPTQQAELIERILSGESHPELRSERNMVAYNTAFRLWIFGICASMNEGLEAALELLRSGKCLPRYLYWVRHRSDSGAFQAA